jgi:hypothetical protein
MAFIDLVSQYWGVGAVAVGAGIYFVTHKSIAISYAKTKISKLMLAAEKAAEQLVLNTGSEKFDWVVDKGYDLLPSAVRIFISKPLFKSLVQELFDEAKAFALKHQIKESSDNSLTK